MPAIPPFCPNSECRYHNPRGIPVCGGLISLILSPRSGALPTRKAAVVHGGPDVLLTHSD